MWPYIPSISVKRSETVAGSSTVSCPQPREDTAARAHHAAYTVTMLSYNILYHSEQALFNPIQRFFWN
jgi:hypothetical protein